MKKKKAFMKKRKVVISIQIVLPAANITSFQNALHLRNNHV